VRYAASDGARCFDRIQVDAEGEALIMHVSSSPYHAAPAPAATRAALHHVKSVVQSAFAD
jgi:hypothetical protein